jgi:uncharacterized protein
MRKEPFVIKYRWPIIIACVLLASVMGLQLKNMRIDADPIHLIPADMPSRANTARLEKIFGSNDMLFIVFETSDVLSEKTLRRVKAISGEMKRIRGVKSVLSLFDTKRIIGENGSMIVEPAVAAIPANDSAREVLRAELAGNELAREVVVSRDFRATGIVLNLAIDARRQEIVKSAERVVDSIPGEEKVMFGGVPAIQTLIIENVAKDLSILLPVALLIILTVLYLFFRQMRGILLPFGVVVLSMVFGMGILPLFGWKMSIMVVLLPIMVVAFSNNYGLYLIARYKELCRNPDGLTAKDLATETFSGLYKPIFFTGLITMAGILGLLSHVIVPARQTGLAAAIAIGFSLLVSLGGIPAVLSLLKIPKTNRTARKTGSILDKSLSFASRAIVRHPKAILAATALVAALGIVLATRIRVDANQENLFGKNHPVTQCTRLINKYFGGSQNISVLFEGDIKDPVLLKKMESYKDTLLKMPGVGSVTSMADVVRIMSKALNDKGEPGYDRIPETRDAVAQYLELYSMSGNPDDFERLVDFNYEKAQFIVRVNDGATDVVENIVRKINEFKKNDKSITLVGGYAAVYTELANAIIRGQTESVIFALIAINILVILLFRSPSAGLLSSIPLLISIILEFGIMGLFGIRLDIVTALTTSIIMGTGVDFTLQFLWKYRTLRRAGTDCRGAVTETLTTTGRAITFNALCIVAGFGALFLSSTPPLRTFALLFCVLTLACMCATLIVVPALCLVWKPKFLDPPDNSIQHISKEALDA